mgnify:CR=1 FL=1
MDFAIVVIGLISSLAGIFVIKKTTPNDDHH